jgi:N-acetyl-beta-hexosaminidase
MKKMSVIQNATQTWLAESEAKNASDELIKYKIINVKFEPLAAESKIVVVDFYFGLSAKTEEIFDAEGAQTGTTTSYSAYFVREKLEFSTGTSNEAILTALDSAWNARYQPLSEATLTSSELVGYSGYSASQLESTDVHTQLLTLQVLVDQLVIDSLGVGL